MSSKLEDLVSWVSAEEQEDLRQQLSSDRAQAPGRYQACRSTPTSTPDLKREATSPVEEGGLTIQLLNRDETYETVAEFASNVRNCVFKAVLEGHVWIIDYLFESSGRELGETIIFDKAIVNAEKTKIIYIRRHLKDKPMNAITFFRDCINGDVESVIDNDEEEDNFNDIFGKEEDIVPTEEEVRSDLLRFLRQLLEWIERNQFLDYVKETISDEGLEWTGGACEIDNEDNDKREKLWGFDSCRKEFSPVFKFFMDRKNEFKDGMKNCIEGTISDVFASMATHDNDLFVKFFSTWLNEDDIEKMLFPRSHEDKFQNILNSWIEALCEGEMEAVRHFWDFLEGKLETLERKQRFLKQRNYRWEWNSLFAPFTNKKDSNVLPLVWGMFTEIFGVTERKKLIFENFVDVEHGDYINRDVLFKFLRERLESGEVDSEEVTQLLLSKDTDGNCFVVDFGIYFYMDSLALPAIHKFQDILLKFNLGKVNNQNILSKLKRVYDIITKSCFDPRIWTESDMYLLRGLITAEFKELKSSNNLWLDESLLDEEVLGSYTISGLKWNKGKKRYEEGPITDVQMKAYYVLMHRQVGLEKECLGEEGAIGKLAEDCWDYIVFYISNKKWRTEDDVTFTRAHLFNHFFNSVSPLLSKEGLTSVLFREDRNIGTFFHLALYENDRQAFLTLYDFSRWMLGLDALCTVHSLAGTGGTLLDLLCRKQRDGLFVATKEVEGNALGASLKGTGQHTGENSSSEGGGGDGVNTPYCCSGSGLVNISGDADRSAHGHSEVEVNSGHEDEGLAGERPGGSGYTSEDSDQHESKRRAKEEELHSKEEGSKGSGWWSSVLLICGLTLAGAVLVHRYTSRWHLSRN